MLIALITLANHLDRVGSISNADKIDALIKRSVDDDWKDLWDLIEVSNKYTPPIKKKQVRLIEVYNAILADPAVLGIFKECCVVWNDYFRKANTKEERDRTRALLYSDSLKVLHDWILEKFGEAEPKVDSNSNMLAMCDAFTSNGLKDGLGITQTPENRLHGRMWRW
jgi:hypothetical protein